MCHHISVEAPSGECERRLKAGMVLFALCDPCLSALRMSYLSSRALYKSTYLYLYLFNLNVVILDLLHETEKL